jgi:hypothetical protein
VLLLEIFVIKQRNCVHTTEITDVDLSSVKTLLERKVIDQYEKISFDVSSNVDL